MESAPVNVLTKSQHFQSLANPLAGLVFVRSWLGALCCPPFCVCPDGLWAGGMVRLLGALCVFVCFLMALPRLLGAVLQCVPLVQCILGWCTVDAAASERASSDPTP